MADAGTPPAKKAKRAGPAAPPNGADRSASDLDSVQLQLSQLRDAMIGLQTQVQYGVAQQARVQAEALRLLRGLAAHVGIETEDGVDEAPARAEPTVATPAANGAGHRPLLADAGQRMSPEVSTVRDLWSEWTVGRGGSPPVKLMEAAFQRKGRKGKGEPEYAPYLTWRGGGGRVFFHARKKIIDAVQTRLDAGADLNVVLDELEAEKRTHSFSSLKAYGQWLAKQAGGGAEETAPAEVEAVAAKAEAEAAAWQAPAAG
mmetsp:Transcript_26111/g.67483  ORF Transcript_26111/g.67483 Transcript_26111/m.67483 type:complete len:259 (+) Transcript_26111:435-1211(+)